MIWPNDISFEGYSQLKAEWYKDPNHWLGDPPVPTQYALDLIFKELVDVKDPYPYLTTMPECTEQVNSIMLDMILYKYSRKYRRYLRKEKRRERKNS